MLLCKMNFVHHGLVYLLSLEARRGHWNLLKLASQMAVSHHVGAGNLKVSSGRAVSSLDSRAISPIQLKFDLESPHS